VSLWLQPAVFHVLLDSCFLYPYELRDLLLQVADAHLYRVHWSAQILEDTVRHLLADGRTSPDQAARSLRWHWQTRAPAGKPGRLLVAPHR
jgi:hypothetical protein